MTLSPETILYIVEWAENGNEGRSTERVPLGVRMSGAATRYRLNSAGITIAALARALKQACDTAEIPGRYSSRLSTPEMREMRATKKELLGE
jgi:hypothetical protein